MDSVPTVLDAVSAAAIVVAAIGVSVLAMHYAIRVMKWLGWWGD